MARPAHGAQHARRRSSCAVRPSRASARAAASSPRRRSRPTCGRAPRGAGLRLRRDRRGAPLSGDGAARRRDPRQAASPGWGGLGGRHARSCCRKAARALERVYVLGIVHRDFKAENVMLVADEEAWRRAIKAVDPASPSWTAISTPPSTTCSAAGVMGAAVASRRSARPQVHQRWRGACRGGIGMVIVVGAGLAAGGAPGGRRVGTASASSPTSASDRVGVPSTTSRSCCSPAAPAAAPPLPRLVARAGASRASTTGSSRACAR